MPQNKMAMMPDMLMPSASTYGAYVNTSIKPNSNDGCLRKSICFKRSALINANTIPMPADAKNIVKNVFNAYVIDSAVLVSGMREIVVVSTIAMASNGNDTEVKRIINDIVRLFYF